MTFIEKIFLTIIICTVFISCNGDDMLLSYQHTVQVGAASMRTKNDTTLLGVSVIGMGREDTLYKAESTDELFLNLDLNNNVTSYIITTHGTLEDEMHFYYSQKLKPVSGSGGISVEVHIDSVKNTSIFIDSVSIEYPDIRYNESLTNVKIFIY